MRKIDLQRRNRDLLVFYCKKVRAFTPVVRRPRCPHPPPLLAAPPPLLL